MATDFYQAVDKGVVAHIHLTPKASKNAIVRTHVDDEGNQRLRITLTAVPEKGKANQSLIGLLSKKLRLPKSSIRLIAGEQSRLKAVLFEGDSKQICEAINQYLVSKNIRAYK